MLFVQKAFNSSDVTCTISTKSFLPGRKIGTSSDFCRNSLSLLVALVLFPVSRELQTAHHWWPWGCCFTAEVNVEQKGFSPAVVLRIVNSFLGMS